MKSASVVVTGVGTGIGRAIIVRLTPHGLKEFTAMAKAHQAWVDGLLSEFDATEADTLIRHLDGLSGRIRHGGVRA